MRSLDRFPVMHITPATVEDAALLAHLVSASNQDVAARFGLTRDNCPRHPSLCETAWIQADMARGEQYFIAYQQHQAVGCVATEYPSAEVAYLNRLAVLPAYRRQGVGAALTRHVLALARQRGVQVVSIGVIAGHVALQRWYQALGFVPGEEKRFAHLPFAVLYMVCSMAESPKTEAYAP